MLNQAILYGFTNGHISLAVSRSKEGNPIVGLFSLEAEVTAGRDPYRKAYKARRKPTNDFGLLKEGMDDSNTFGFRKSSYTYDLAQ